MYSAERYYAPRYFAPRYFAGATGLVVALTGVVGTGAAGSATVSHSQTQTGVAATGSVGTASFTHTQSLTGVAATCVVGTVGVAGDATRALTGVSTTTAVGTLAPVSSVTTTGVSSSGSVGTVTQAKTLALAGQSTTGTAGNVGTSQAGTAGITGVVAASATGTVGVSGSGSLTIASVSTAGQVGVLTATRTTELVGVSATGDIGSVVESYALLLTGVVGSTGLGDLVVSSSSTVVLTGVQVSGALGYVTPPDVIRAIHMSGLTVARRVNERSVFLIEFDILDEENTGVSAAELSSVTLTLLDIDTYVPGESPAVGIINDRDAQEVLNTGNVLISTDGHVEWSLQPEDNIIVTPIRQIERHRAELTFTWPQGSALVQFEIEVVNLRNAS